MFFSSVCLFSCVAVASSRGQSGRSSVSHVCCSTRSGVQSEDECPNAHHPPTPSYSPSLPAATADLTHADWHDPRRSEPKPARRLPDLKPRGQRSPHASHQLIGADQRPTEPSGDVRRAADAENGWIGEI